MPDLKLGDAVRLTSGGPSMTITALSGDLASVAWFVADALLRADLPLAALVADTPVVAPRPECTDDSIGAYIERTYPKLEMSGDTHALEWPFQRVGQAKGRKGPFIQFTTELGRVGFWPNAAHGPFIRVEKK